MKANPNSAGSVACVLCACACVVLSGCQSPKGSTSASAESEPPPGETSVVQMTRNNCFSLLYQLLNDQKNVSKLRFIKREHPDVKALIQNISSQSAAGAEMLKNYAKADPTLLLNDIRLPPGERATRDAIAATHKKELLSHSGEDFELRLLLTQVEALSYAWHLAKVAAEKDNQPERARSLTELSDRMRHLHQQLFELLASRTKAPAVQR